MPHIPLIVGLGLALCQGALAQNPPPASPNAPLRLTLDDAMERARANSPQILSANIAALLAREDTVQAKAALLPDVSSFNQFIYTQPNGTPSGIVRIQRRRAMERARANSPQILSANIAALLAREDTVQARAALLPGVNSFNQFIYTQPNGTPSGVFVSNDGPHVYNNQAIVHGDIFALGKRADYRKTPGGRSRGARQSGNRRARPGRRRDAELLRHGLGHAQAAPTPSRA